MMGGGNVDGKTSLKGFSFVMLKKGQFWSTLINDLWTNNSKYSYFLFDQILAELFVVLNRAFNINKVGLQSC